MNIEQSVLANGVRHVRLRGRLDMYGSTAIEEQFNRVIADATGGVVVDLADVEFIASIGIRMLLTNARTLRERGGKLVLCNPRPFVLEIFEIAGLPEIITIYDDFEAACAAVESAA
jgi:anti-anti-sigma factor